MPPPPPRAAAETGSRGVTASQDGLAGSALRGVFWAGASRFGGRLLFFASTLLLARLLEREDFGVAAYAITVITLFGAIPGLGLAPALIHHRDDPALLDTGFWLGLAAGALAFAVVFALSPIAGWAFGDPRATDVTRAMALVFPFEALRNVHATLLRKRLAFRRRFVPDIIQSTAKGVLAIGLALAGFGYWSLVWGSVGATAVAVPVYWMASEWRPGLRFDRAALRSLLPFGSRVVAVDLLGALIRNVDYLVVGRLLGAAVLGVYTLAFRIPDLLIRNLCLTLGQVLLPLYAQVRNDPEAVRDTFQTSLAYITALTAPMAVGLSLVAEPLVVVAFSAKWRDVAAVIPPICAYAMIVSLTFNLGDLYKALGRPEILVRLAFLRALVVVPAVWIAADAFGSAAAVGWAQAGGAGFAAIANLAVASSLFGLPVAAALSRVAPILLAAGVMSAAVVALRPALEGSADLTRLVLLSGVGAAVYLVALRLLAREFCESGLRVATAVLTRRRAMSGATS